MMGGTSHPTAGTIGGAMDYIGELSQSSQFKFNLYLNGIGTGEPNEDLNSWLNSCGLFGGDSNDQTLKYELLCHQAQLPGTQFELATEKGGFQGLTETFARARQFTQFAVSFYVDTDYNVLRLFEEWMNFINPLTTQEGPTETGYPSGSLLRGSASDRNGFLRMRYPESYKKIIGITKFERNAGFAANTNINESTPGSEKFIQNFRRSLDPVIRKQDLENQVDGFLGEGLPHASNLWSKAGLMSEVRHDVAWWVAPRQNPMLVAVFTIGEKLAKDRFLIPAIGSELNKLSI